jgi:hypothetical protein
MISVNTDDIQFSQPHIGTEGDTALEVTVH